jgi:PHD/YefM family antitoxin component YafN of YafNO toxin-antitoxin module
MKQREDDIMMNALTADEASVKFFSLIDEMAESHIPVLITGENNNVALISEDDWCAIQETMHLLSIPNMRESIIEGMNASHGECLNEEELLSDSTT